LGGRNFCPLALSAPKARLGWERFRHSAFSGISKQKSFLFLLEEKNQCAQIKNCEESFFAGWQSIIKWSVTAGLASLLEVLLKKSSNINQKTPQ